MAGGNRVRLTRVVLVIIVLVQLVVVLRSLLVSPSSLPYVLVRAAALFAYITLFWTIVSSEYVREVKRLFGLPYLNLHHHLSRVAWALIIVHPLSYALTIGDFGVFVPILSPWSVLITWAGRPALYLFLVATLAAVLRARNKRYWKYLHKLNYVAFLLIFVHSWRLGQDLGDTWLRAVWAAMAVTILLVALHKGLGRK